MPAAVPVIARFRHMLPYATLALAVTAVTACGGSERVKQALRGDVNADPVWKSDSLLIALKPDVLYRVLDSKIGAQAVPIALIGSRGFRDLQLSNRGWRAFDLEFLHSGHVLTQYRDGRAVGDVTTKRGMWLEGGSVLDSVPGCNVMLPGALIDAAKGVQLVTNGKRPALKPSVSLSDGELQTALAKVATLVAPIKGIPLAILAKYTRTVHLVDNGSGGKPTIVVLYDDPEIAADTVMVEAQRPRQLVVFLDNGVYGYRTSYTYTTVGNRRAPPRYRWLDYVDIDDDGKADILMGITLPDFPLYTQVIHRQGEDWAEAARYNHRRCQG